MKRLALALLSAALPAAALTPEEAAKICDEYASPLDPQLPAGIEYRHYHRPEHFERDRQACLITLERDPHNPRIAYQTGEVYQNRHQYLAIKRAAAEEAAENREGQTQEAVPDLLSSNTLARRYWYRGRDYPPARYAQAMNTLDKETQKQMFEELLPDHPALAHYGLGKWYAMQKNDAQAREHYAQAVAAGNRYALLSLVQKEQDSPHYGERLREAAEKSQRPGAWSALERYLRGQGNSAEADAVLAKMREKARTNPDYAVSLAMREAKKHLDNKNFSAALPYLREAAEGGMNAAVAVYEITRRTVEKAL